MAVTTAKLEQADGIHLIFHKFTHHMEILSKTKGLNKRFFMQVILIEKNSDSLLEKLCFRLFRALTNWNSKICNYFIIDFRRLYDIISLKACKLLFITCRKGNDMLYTYAECLEEFGSKYNVNKMISAGTLYKLEKGIYSDVKYVPELQIISKKYPRTVFTMNSAFYYHNLTDTIPEKFHLATSRGTSRIADSRVFQHYENSDQLMTGAEYIMQDNVLILMYNKERMLLELLRSKNRLPFDFYKEILVNYRNIINNLDIQAIQDYAYLLPKSRMIFDALQTEVL